MWTLTVVDAAGQQQAFAVHTANHLSGLMYFLNQIGVGFSVAPPAPPPQPTSDAMKRVLFGEAPENTPEEG